MTSISLLFLIDEIDDVLILFDKFKSNQSARILFALQTKLTQLNDLFNYKNHLGEDRYIITNHEHFVEIYKTINGFQPGIKLDPETLSLLDIKMLGLTRIRVNPQNETILHHHSTIKRALDFHAVVSRTDLNGTITSVNQKFIDITGYTREQLIGSNHRVLNSRKQPPEFFEKMWKTISKGKAWHDTVCNRRKGGELYWVETSVMPQFNYKGEINGYISIRTDITHTVLAQIEVEKALKEAEKANQAKSQFLTSMTHELRTPLNSVIGYSQLLMRENLSSEQKDKVKNIQKSGEYLLGLINDLLDLSSIESGKFSINPEELHLNELIKASLRITLPAATEKGISLHYNAETINPNLKVFADKTRLPQILLNFLSNAVKYNKENGQVFVEVEEVSNQPDLVTDVKITIRDTGVGIPEKLQSSVFESFNRLGHEASSIEGTGVGLAITKDLIEMMGGQVGFHSQVGVGTSFWFTLPVPVELKIKPQKVCNIPEEVAVRRASLKVLYIESDPMFMELMLDVFDEIDQHHLLISPTAEHGIGQAKNLTPDVILMDINLPDIPGNHLIKIFRQMPNLIQHQTKIYVVTNEDPLTSPLLTNSEDFDAIIKKNFDKQTIVELLNPGKA